MLFHSYLFAVFLTAVLLLHRLAPPAGRRWVLLVASYTFYGSWNARYALLILASTVIDYAVAQRIAASDDPRARKRWLIASLATNLGILAVFKYYNFFIDSLRVATDWPLPIHTLLLPVGISFYTFQSMSYTIDVYRGRASLARGFVDFALYVSFFPQLVAGPIVRAVEFLPQLEGRLARPPEKIRLGIKLFLFGLFRKLVIADNLAVYVDRVHADPGAFTQAELWVCAYAFAFQIYYDFAGYSEMAIGLAHLFGFTFPDNFRRPYCAVNVSDFWRRWHITLSTWLRDYLYISLGGNRAGRWKTLRNLMITMVLGGLWHGANWTFVIWGFLHGSYLIVHRVFQDACRRLPALGALAAQAWMLPIWILLTFHAWTLSMVFFRAESLDVATSMLRRMAGLVETGAPEMAARAMPLVMPNGLTVASTFALCVGLFLLQLSQKPAASVATRRPIGQRSKRTKPSQRS
ncbi:MAG: MBOAT family protein [Acidobacteriota bacterium]